MGSDGGGLGCSVEQVSARAFGSSRERCLDARGDAWREQVQALVGVVEVEAVQLVGIGVDAVIGG